MADDQGGEPASSDDGPAGSVSARLAMLEAEVAVLKKQIERLDRGLSANQPEDLA